MTTETERRLQAAARATDAVVAGWAEPGAVPLPAARTARTRWRRVLYPVLSAAAVAAVVIAAVLTTGGGSGSGPAPAARSTSTPSAATSTVAPPTTDAPTRATAELQRHIAGLRQLSPTWMTDGSFWITAEYWTAGRHLADVNLEVGHAVHASAGNPCVLAKGETPGHQGAPAPDDRCTLLPQADGAPVWLRRMGHSAYRPWTTARTKDWLLSQVRDDGTVVTLDVTSMIGNRPSGDPIYASVPFRIALSQLVAVVTSADVAWGGPCTRHCVLPGPPTQQPTH